MFTIIFLFGVSVALAYVVYRAIAVFAKSEGTLWERLLATSRESAVMIWSKVLALAGTLITWAALSADYLNMPELHTFLTAVLKPEHVGIILLAIAGINVLARLRTLFTHD